MPQRSFLCQQMPCKSLQGSPPPCRNASMALSPACACTAGAEPGHRGGSGVLSRGPAWGQRGIGRGVMEQAECSRMRPRELGMEPLGLPVFLPATRVLGTCSTHNRGEELAWCAQHKHAKPLRASCQPAPSMPCPPLPMGGQRRALAPWPQLFARQWQYRASRCLSLRCPSIR